MPFEPEPAKKPKGKPTPKAGNAKPKPKRTKPKGKAKGPKGKPAKRKPKAKAMGIEVPADVVDSAKKVIE